MGKALTIALLLAIGLLTGCATSGSAPDDPRQVWCDHSQPRRDYRPDMDRAEVNVINAHNAKGTAWCNWSP